MNPVAPPKSTGEMMTDILSNVSNLVRNETDLARAEVADSLEKAGASLGAIALALALGVVGLNVLAGALVMLVIWAGLPPHWAAVAVGGGFVLIALLIFIAAKSTLHQIGFAPTRTARNVARDVAVFKDSFNDK